jgi:hypothetical protein
MSVQVEAVMALEHERIGSEVYQQPFGMLVHYRVLAESDLLADSAWILDPPFQRGAVWTLKQKRAWIETLLRGLGLPAIFVNQFPQEHEIYSFREVVIDGQQRLRATAEFMQDKFRVRGELWSEQTEVFQRGFKHSQSNCNVVLCKYRTLKECAELYLKLLTAGTAHTSEEIKKAKRYIAKCGDVTT